MPSSFFGIDIASRALRSFEMALNVTGHNLANVNTEGYSRQRITIEQTPSVTFYGLLPTTLGSGSWVHNVSRIRDAFLEGRFLQTNSEGSRLGQLQSSLVQLENVFGEPGIDGIQSAMTSMFDAWHQLSVNPADEGSRLNVRMTASLYISRVRDAHNQMVGNVVRLEGEATDTIRNINQLADEIVELNTEIRQQAASGAQPNDLMDQRDLLLRRLSELVDIRTQVMPDQTISVFIHQHTLVNPIEAKPLPLTFDAATSTLTDGSKSILIRGGRLAGIFGSINANNMYSSRLDQLVDDVRTQVNTIHAAGTNLNGSTGIDFFAGSAGAGDLDLDPAVLADIRNIAAGASGESGDGGLAQAISALRDLPSPALGGRSVLSYYADMISTLGQDAKSAGNSVETQAAVLTQLETQQQAISGVNIDEEMATMMRYQRSFQAAAKLLSVLDQTTEELIKSFGR